MYYKVIKDNKVIDVLDSLNFFRYQEKHKIMISCDESIAQGILSSDGKRIWHEESLYKIPVGGYDTVKIEEIDEYEYEQLKILNLKSAEEIFDSTILYLINNGII